MSTSTTLRVRIPMQKRPGLETRALKKRAGFREYLVETLEAAVDARYSPKSLIPTRDTRLPMPPALKLKMRELANDLGATRPEDYALAVLEDLLNGDFSPNGKKRP